MKSEILKNAGVLNENIKKFSQDDFEKELEKLLEIDDTGGMIYHTGHDRNSFNFDYDRALEKLKELKDKYYYKMAIKNWPKSATEKLKSLPKETKIQTKRKKL